MGSILAADGPEATEAWCEGLVANMARPPEGGDTDQIEAVAAGVGDVAISNTYYLARLVASASPTTRTVDQGGSRCSSPTRAIAAPTSTSPVPAC